MILDLIKKSRSHRNFSEKKINEEEIKQILECSRYSSNGRNLQELRFTYTVKDDECKEVFKNISLAGALKEEEKPKIQDRPRAIIAILTPQNITKKEKVLYFDIGVVSQNITLMLNEMNYSSCMLMSFNEQAIKKVFNLSEIYTIKALIILGKAKDKVKIIDIENKNFIKNYSYYRENGIHYLPKLKLEDLIIK